MRRGLSAALTLSIALVSAGAVTVAWAQATEPSTPDPAAPDPAQPARVGPAATGCSAPRLSARLLTSIAGTVPRGATLLVSGDPRAAAPTVALRRGRRRSSPVRTIGEVIAPGLWRLRPDARRMFGRYQVEGVDGAPQLVFGRGSLPAPPAAPRIERVERYVAISNGRSRPELRAHLAFPIPAGVVAIVSYFDGDDTPDVFAFAVAAQSEAVLWSSVGPCGNFPQNATEPPREGSVRITFVDQFGQVSQLSEPTPLSR